MRAGDRGEIRITKFELDGARVKPVFAQTPSNLLGEVSQRCVQLIFVAGIGVEGMFVADRFRVVALADCGVEPSSCVETLGFTCEGEPPFSEARFEIPFRQTCKIADAANTD